MQTFNSSFQDTNKPSRQSRLPNTFNSSFQDTNRGLWQEIEGAIFFQFLILGYRSDTEVLEYFGYGLSIPHFRILYVADRSNDDNYLSIPHFRIQTWNKLEPNPASIFQFLILGYCYGSYDSCGIQVLSIPHFRIPSQTWSCQAAFAAFFQFLILGYLSFIAWSYT